MTDFICCSARIDNFSEQPSKKFGDVLRGQVEDRLEFYATGKKPTKNADVMVSCPVHVGHCSH